MFIKPLNYYSTTRGFLSKAYGHGKVMASKLDSILKQGMDIYGAVKPIAQEAASAYGGARTQQALSVVDKNIAKGAKMYQGYRSEAIKGAALAERLGNAIGGY